MTTEKIENLLKVRIKSFGNFLESCFSTKCCISYIEIRICGFKNGNSREVPGGLVVSIGHIHRGGAQIQFLVRK